METRRQEPAWRRGLSSPAWEPLHGHHRPLCHFLAPLVASHGPPPVPLPSGAPPGFPPGVERDRGQGCPAQCGWSSQGSGGAEKWLSPAHDSRWCEAGWKREGGVGRAVMEEPAPYLLSLS